MTDFSKILECSQGSQKDIVGIFTNSVPHDYHIQWIRFLQECGFRPNYYFGLFTPPEGETSTAHTGIIDDIANAVAVTIFLFDSSEITDTKNWIVPALEAAEQWNPKARRELFYCSADIAVGGSSEPMLNAHAIHVIHSEDEMYAALEKTMACLES